MKRIYGLLIVLLFFTTTLYTQVHNRTTGINYSSISNALSAASNGHLIEVDIGTYNESLDLSGFTKLTLRATDWTQSHNNTTTILDGGGTIQRIIEINNGSQNKIIGFTIKNSSQYGIYILGTSISNWIMNNQIYSNNSYGVYINSDDADNNFILTNNIYGTNQDRGIYISQGDNNIICLNQIHNNQSFGIYFQDDTTGNYIVRNTIYSNETYGVFINSDDADNNYILANNIWGEDQDSGIYILDGDNNIISSNQIHNNQSHGIYISDSASNNYIVKNSIYSNDLSGIHINSATAGQNYILTNNIWGRNQNHAIQIYGADNNIIASNQLHHNELNGMRIYNTATYNYIIKNNIYSNITGVFLESEETDNNFILENNIWGNSSYGLHINDADNNLIRDNQIHHNDWGVRFGQSATNNFFIKNSFYSNEDYGIFMDTGTGNKNYILTNIFYGKNQNYGLYINDATNIKIYHNLFHNNEFHGIGLAGSANSIEIINNTIFGTGNNGVYWTGTSSGFMLNNIILSNGMYGIEESTSGTINIAYNCIYGNNGGPTNSDGVGSFIWGAGNITNNPLIETVTSYTIISEYSPCVDNGTNIPGVTDNFIGSGPDMGWKEFGTENTPPITTADKKEGFYSTEFDVTLTSVDPESPYNIIIYYTTDGSDPKSSSTVQNGPSPVTIRINKTTTLKFYAKNSRGYEEDVQTIEYSFTKIPEEDVAVYNNYLDLSKGEPARIIFGKAGNVEIKIYNIKGVLVRFYDKQYYKAGESQDWYGIAKDTAKKVGAGLYIVVIKGDINKKLKMIVKK